MSTLRTLGAHSRPPFTRADTLGDRAVAWASAVGFVAVIVLLVVERLA